MFDYYQAPSQEVFDEIKAKAIVIRNSYDDSHWYALEKIDRIKDIENIRDNARYIVGMFDMYNQAKLLSMVNEETYAVLQEVLRQI